jgi:hypothetical protein
MLNLQQVNQKHILTGFVTSDNFPTPTSSKCQFLNFPASTGVERAYVEYGSRC